MSKAERISLLNKTQEINTEIDELIERKYETQKKIEEVTKTSRAASISLLKKIRKINNEIDGLKEKKYEIQKKIEKECDTNGHLFGCYIITSEYDCDDNFIGTKYYSKCLICGKPAVHFYHGLHEEEIKNGLYACKYLIEIATALINSNIHEANMFFKEECEYDSKIEKLDYMSKILKEIGYTIDYETKTIIPISQ